MDKDLWAEIRYLHGSGKLSVRALARRMGISRRTVRRALASAEGPARSGARPGRASKLEAYRPEIERLLGDYPGISGVRIFEELVKRGYTGGRTILKECLQRLRRPAQEAFFRLHFAPGEQAQVDWGSCGTIMVAGHSRRFSVFAMVLSYSRMLYLEFTASERIEVFLQCHVNAFRFFGGVPGIMLYDNLKSVVLQRSGGAVRFNSRYLDFAGWYGVQPRACGVAKGNEKGRVESAIKYIKGNFLAGRTFRDLDDANAQARHWRDTIANVRIHGSTHRRPAELFEEERPHLRPLPASGYDCAVTVPVRASKDGFVRFETNSYSVPSRCAGLPLVLKAAAHEVKIFRDCDLAAVHRRRHGGNREEVEDPAHVAGLLREKKRARELKGRDRFLLLGENASLYRDGLVRTRADAQRHTAAILKLADLYGRTSVLDAIQTALGHEAFGADYIENIILQRRAREGRTDPAHTLLLDDTTGFGDVVIPPPDLARYDRAAEADDDDDKGMPDDNDNDRDDNLDTEGGCLYVR